MFLCAAAGALGGLLYGFSLAVIAGVEPFVKDRFALGNTELGLVVSNLDLGAALGAVVTGLVSDRLGRKKILISTAIFFLLSITIAACAETVGILFLGRLLGGVAVGASMILPLYIAEISPAKQRGLFVSLVQMAIVTGILSAYLSGWLLVDAGPSNWQWMFAVGIPPAALFLATVSFLPESPRWLASRVAREAVGAVLARSGAGVDSDAALREIRDSLGSEKGKWGELFAPGPRRAMGRGLLVTIFSVTVGINAVIFYGPMILMEGAESSVSAALLGSVFLGGVNFSFSIIAVVCVDRCGRKPLLLWGLVGMLGAMVVLGLTFHPGESSPWVLASILIFVAFYAVSLGPVTWVFVSEIFPTRLRGLAVSLCMVAMYLADFAVTFLFPAMMDRLGRTSFMVFAAVCAAAALFTLGMVPETRGKSLEEIEAMWAPRRGGLRS